MSAQIPTLRQTAWISLIPQLMFMGLLTLGFYLVESNEPVLYGAITYLAFSFGLKMYFAKYHKQGIALANQQKYSDAITYFEKSYDFFSKNSWIDKYRYLTLLDSSKICYREMALCNIACCYHQIGQRMKAVLYYKQALKEFPENVMAQSALGLLLPEDELKATTD